MCCVQRLTSGVSYVCPSSLSLPHLVMRPLGSPSDPDPRVTEYQRVLKSEVSSQHSAKPPLCIMQKSTCIGMLVLESLSPAYQ